ncbi:MAG: ATP-binding protein [Sphingomonadales bacterium]|jgi:two-component system nitrogen regulation sensor histidine kinase GlnL
MSWRLLAGLAVPAVLVRADGGIELVNNAAEAFLNQSQPALMERGWAAAFGPDNPVAALVARALHEGASCSAYAMPLRFADGRHTVADVLVSPVPDAPEWLTVAFQLRAVASMGERQSAQAGAARTAVGAAAMLAHEIKNPLSGIRGAAQLLAGGLKGDDRDLTSLIISEVDRIAKLIDRMESFTDTRPLPLQAENIHAILGHARQLAATGFARDMHITERYDPSLPPVPANRDALVQLFLNLLKNAAEAAGPGGQIVVATAFRSGFRVHRASGPLTLPIEVRILDSGPGVDASVADHVFEPFVSTRKGGTGLGLALVAKVAADHGGLVEYERTGDPPMTMFRVMLPMARPRGAA